MTRFIYKHRNKAKVCTYSMMHMTVAITVAFLLSGSWLIALGIGIIEPMVQTVAYVLHEKSWVSFSENIGKSLQQL